MKLIAFMLYYDYSIIWMGIGKDKNKEISLRLISLCVGASGGRYAPLASPRVKTKDESKLSLLFFLGASGGSRNLISSLENLHTNRCTTLASC